MEEWTCVEAFARVEPLCKSATKWLFKFREWAWRNSDITDSHHAISTFEDLRATDCLWYDAWYISAKVPQKWGLLLESKITPSTVKDEGRRLWRSASRSWRVRRMGMTVKSDESLTAPPIYGVTASESVVCKALGMGCNIIISCPSLSVSRSSIDLFVVLLI